MRFIWTAIQVLAMTPALLFAVPAGAAQQQANTFTQGAQKHPTIARLENGYVVVWESEGQDGSGYGVYGQRYNVNGVAQGATDLPVNTTTTGNQTMPKVAGLPSAIDPMLFSDENGRLFYYWGCSPRSGIWGVELEYVRAGRSSDETPLINPLAQAGSISVNLVQLLPGVAPGIPIPFPFEYRSEVRRRHTSMNAVAWARQPVGDAVDLVYLAGIAFTRERSDVTQNISPVPRAIVPPTSIRSTFTEYATRPLVGMEARIGLTPRLRLIPGLRVQGLGDGWLVRPNVAIGWFF